MKKQDILETLVNNPNTVFCHKSDWWRRFIITEVLESGALRAKMVTVKDRDDDSNQLPVEDWQVNINGSFTIITRNVGAVIANSPEAFLQDEIRAEQERKAEREKMQADFALHKTQAQTMIQALYDAGLVTEEEYLSIIGLEWFSWGTVTITFNLSVADRLVQLLSAQKVEA